MATSRTSAGVGLGVGSSLAALATAIIHCTWDSASATRCSS